MQITRMNRRRQRGVMSALTAVALAALAAVFATGAASAGDWWKDASGTGISVAVPLSITQQGANTLVILAPNGSFAGTFSGPLVDNPDGKWLIHPDGTSRVEGTGYTTAVLGDCGAVPGGVQYRYVLFGQTQADGSITFDGFAQALGPQAVNYQIELSGVIPAGGLANTFTYTGHYRCRDS